MKMALFIYLMTFYGLIGCDKRAELNPHVSHFKEAEQLKKFDGTELPDKLSNYIKKTQDQHREVASSENALKPYSPSVHPKFPMPYILVPEAMAQFFSPTTEDESILDQLYLRVSGIKHYKFLVHPYHENEFQFMRGFYTYIGADRTEFYATPTTDANTLIIWNRNNSKRKPFLVILKYSEHQGNLDRQIISDLPIKVPDGKN